jgi:DNA sulfur modification protein DndD
MKFLTLELENWSSYGGNQNSVTFAKTPKAEITVITAKNGAGKTSILKAFSFALYGTVSPSIARTGDTSKLEDFPNRPGLESGQEITTSVTLTFEYKDAEWKLQRKFTAKQSQNSELLILGPVQTSLIQVGKGSGISTEKIDDFINDNILNQKVSHFYFFDGVLLEEIQSQLTRKDEISRKLVMNSVENALGLRFLDHLHLNLKACLAKVDNEIASQQRAQKQNETLLKKIKDEQEALDALQADVERIENLKSDEIAKREQHDRNLQAIDPSTKEKAIERAQLIASLESLEEEKKQVVEELRREGERAWLSPLSRSLSELFTQQETEESARAELRDKATALKSRISNLESSLENKSCTLCGHSHDESEISRISKEISELRKELEGLPFIANTSESLLFKVGRALAESNRIDVVKAVIAKHDGLLVKIADAKRKIGKIGDELGNFTENIDVKWEEAQRAEADFKIATYDGHIKEANDKIDRLRSSLGANRAKLTEDKSVSKKDQDTRQLIDVICRSIEASFEGFRDEMRAQVQEKATEYLGILTSEPEIYGSVEISSDYQIRIKSPDGKLLQIANAGHKQILTTAFVSAMAAVSTETTPFVMDTALSHLDVENSRQMLQWAKYVDQQVILLVTPKELPKQIAHDVLGSAIGRQYEIQKVSAEVSKIKELD